jgi:hypothetical protein
MSENEEKTEQMLPIPHRLYTYKDKLVYVNGISKSEKAVEVVIYKDLLNPIYEFLIVPRVEFLNRSKEISIDNLKDLYNKVENND